ncbi:MAG: hypothetical protein A2W23_06355 [Planctomycetes bacterium RBG_16_43_13]|nr:MAG: hypothetical protein A2W23_06355 [Planctomycetes bacterium RBG_16_43_13]
MHIKKDYPLTDTLIADVGSCDHKVLNDSTTIIPYAVIAFNDNERNEDEYYEGHNKTITCLECILEEGRVLGLCDLVSDLRDDR